MVVSCLVNSNVGAVEEGGLSFRSPSESVGNRSGCLGGGTLSNLQPVSACAMRLPMSHLAGPRFVYMLASLQGLSSSPVVATRGLRKRLSLGELQPDANSVTIGKLNPAPL